MYYPGSRVHGETNGELRTQLAAMGWIMNDDDNIARSISPNGEVVITALSGDMQTGLSRGPEAQTKRPRGAAGIRIVRRNSQLVLEGLLPEGDAELIDPAMLGPTWFLLYYRDGDIARSELSLAKAVSDAGALLEWSERLLLPSINMLDGPAGGDDHHRGDDPILDVPVTRRTA